MKSKKNKEKKEEIFKSILEIVPQNYLVKQGFPAIVQDDQIIMRPTYGLNMFLASWIENNSDDPNLLYNISRFLENFNDYIDHSKRILKFSERLCKNGSLGLIKAGYKLLPILMNYLKK